MALDRFIPLSEAAHRMKVSVKKTRLMIASGKIQGGILPDGEMVVSINSIPLKKEDLPEYKKYEKLNGVAIWVSEASRKYKIPHGNIARWSKSGFISVIGKNGNRTLLNEQDVAYCAEIYGKHKGQGKWIFNEDGTPYKNGS